MIFTGPTVVKVGVYINQFYGINEQTMVSKYGSLLHDNDCGNATLVTLIRFTGRYSDT